MTVAFALALCCAVPTFGFVQVLALHADTPQLRRRRIVALENINRSAPGSFRPVERCDARVGRVDTAPTAPTRARSHHPVVRPSGGVYGRAGATRSPARPLSRGGLT